MQPPLLSELDLKVVHGLQIVPRVTWSEAGRILGVGAQTLAARWERMHSRGLAWVAAYPGGDYRDHVTALVEVECTGAQRRLVVDRLCADPRVLTVEESARDYDLTLTVMTADLRRMSDFVVGELGSMPGVSRRRTFVATSVHRDGSSWRLDALDPTERAAFEALRIARHSRRTPPPAGSWPLVEALAVDGRRSAADIAAATGRNPATVRRQLPRLLASDAISVRCEIAQDAARRPVSCTWRARIAAVDEARTVDALRTLPQLRLCMSTTGSANLVITVWAADLAEILDIERLLGDRLPWLVVHDNSINLRTVKRVGHLLDADGHASGRVVAPTALRADDAVSAAPAGLSTARG